MSDLISREEVLNLIDTAFESGAFDGRYAYENLIDAVQNLIHPLETDLISRQAAIEAMEEIYCHVEMIKRRPVSKGEQALFLDMREAIKGIPSVELEKRTEERTETHACDCISREAAFDEILREVETLRRDVRELKELLGYIREYGITKDKTPRHIGQRFCEIVDGWEEEDLV